MIAVGSVGLDVDVMATLTGQEATPTGPLRIADLIRRFGRGDFDLISIGRSLIGDPDWVVKMRDGRGAEIRPFRRTDLEWLPRRGHFGRPYGPWTGMAIMLAWTVAALVGGYLVLVRTGVSGGSRRWRTPAQAR